MKKQVAGLFFQNSYFCISGGGLLEKIRCVYVCARDCLRLHRSLLRCRLETERKALLTLRLLIGSIMRSYDWCGAV